MHHATNSCPGLNDGLKEDEMFGSFYAPSSMNMVYDFAVNCITAQCFMQLYCDLCTRVNRCTSINL